MATFPPMISKHHHEMMDRRLAAYAKVEAEATLQEREDHRYVHDWNRYDFDRARRSEIDNRVISLLESDWQPEGKETGEGEKSAIRAQVYPNISEQKLGA
jgi:hypothetical protein